MFVEELPATVESLGPIIIAPMSPIRVLAPHWVIEKGSLDVLKASEHALDITSLVDTTAS